MKLQARLSMTTALPAILASVVVLLVSYFVGIEALEEATWNKMITVQAARHAAVQSYLQVSSARLKALAGDPGTRDSMNDFVQAFNQLGDNAQFRLQQRYVVANELPREERDRFIIADNPDGYDKAHNHHHDHYRNRHRFLGMDDLLLIDPKGNVVYSLLKEKDFATNLLTGPWPDSGLARAVKPLLTNPVPGVASFVDFSRYPASDNLAVAFLALPVFDADKQRFIGVIATELPAASFSTLMRDNSGLGESGEAFLVSHDGWMLTASRFDSESGNTELSRQLKTEAVKRVLAGEDGMVLAPDYRGIPSYILFKPVQAFPEALGEKPHWGMIVKTSRDEALHDIIDHRQTLMALGVLSVLAASLFSAWTARSISMPIVAIQSALTKLAHGEEAQVPGMERRDEIGNMAQAADSFRQMSQQIERSHWLNEHLAGLTNLASSQFSMNELPNAILKYLCQCLDIPVAAMYFCDEHKEYSRVGIHGLARRSQAEDHFALGTGLVGQCARDRQAIILSPVPAGLAVISTGLGEFEPQELTLYPIPHKNEVLAVLELASLHRLTPHQHEFLVAATNGLGLHLANLQASEHNLTLLNETRQQAEVLAEQRQRIEEVSRYARSLIEASLDPLVTIGAKGQIMDVNSATEKVTGIVREQLIGSDFSDYFTEPDQARRGYQQAFSEGSVIDYPLAIRHVSGKITDVLYNASVYYDADGKVAGVFAAARDVTVVKQQQEALHRNNEEMQALAEELKAQNEEFRTNQEELRAQQDEMQHKNQLLETQRRELERAREEAEARARELARANQYKSDFLANMSHELRTPLNSILILAKNLSENQDGNLNADQVESAAVINESGNHLLTLINDILDLSKIEAGRFELFLEDFPLNEVMCYLRGAFAPLAEKKGIGLDIEIDPTAPEIIHGDRQRITQILTNLLSNAVKFTDAGQVKLLARQLDGSLQFEITDTGIGIPPDKIETIFGAFQQGDGSTSRKYGGSGLGLAISKRLVELMGGTISVDSMQGRGSTFTVTLPVKPIETGIAATAAPQIAAKKSRPVTHPVPQSVAPVLLVEDDDRLVSILERLIDTLGFPVASVESGEKALAYIGKTQPCGILLDLGLPGIQGMEVLRKLKEKPSTAGIPVFIMSGAEDTGEARTLGALGFLKKPVTKDSIGAAIREMLAQSAAVEGRQTVLLIEDTKADVLALQTLFRRDPLDIVSMQTGNEALQWLAKHRPDAIILDLQLPDISGFEWLRRLNIGEHPPIIVYSARELTGDELFQLRKYADAVVTKGDNTERLHDELLRVLTAGGQQPQPTTPTPASTPATDRRLLLVDDDVRNLFALAKALRRKGFSVEVVPSGIKALELLQQQSFDAVLIDIMMPEMDGYTLMDRIRGLGYRDLPLIAVTAKAMPGDIELCLEAGANDYVPKPVDIDKLLEVLGKWL